MSTLFVAIYVGGFAMLFALWCDRADREFIKINKHLDTLEQFLLNMKKNKE